MTVPPLHNLKVATIGARPASQPVSWIGADGDQVRDPDASTDGRDPATAPLRPKQAEPPKVVYVERKGRFFLFRPFTISYDYPCVCALIAPGTFCPLLERKARESPSACKLTFFCILVVGCLHRCVLRALAHRLLSRSGYEMSAVVLERKM